MDVNGQIQAPAAKLPGIEPWYPLDRRLGGPQSRDRRCALRESNPGRAARSLVTALTELSRLACRAKLYGSRILSEYAGGLPYEADTDRLQYTYGKNDIVSAPY
jgi:hypothetical protein